MRAINLTRAKADQFRSLLQAREPNACWEWQGARDNSGYGYFSVSKGVSLIASRVSYTLANGPIPDGLYVCHHCDNPSCCNPAHLFLGTHVDNMADMRAKGRSATGEKNGTRTRPERRARGERHGRRRMSEADVMKIRAMHYDMGLRCCDVATLLGERRQTVSRVLRGDRWSHLARPEDAADRRITLDDFQVRQMRAMRKRIGLSVRDIAKIFDAPLGTVEKIVSNQTRRAA